MEIFFHDLLQSVAHSLFWVIIIGALAGGVLVVLNYDYPEIKKKRPEHDNDEL
jgi:hypothetical protein